MEGNCWKCKRENVPMDTFKIGNGKVACGECAQTILNPYSRFSEVKDLVTMEELLTEIEEKQKVEELFASIKNPDALAKLERIYGGF